MISTHFNSAALRQFTKYNIFLEAHSFFGKINLILDTPSLNKKTELTLMGIIQLGISQNENKNRSYSVGLVLKIHFLENSKPKVATSKFWPPPFS